MEGGEKAMTTAGRGSDQAVPDSIDEGRLAALRSSGVMDSEPDALNDHLAEIAATMCCARIGLVSFIDADRQWFKASHGATLTQVAYDQSICRHVLVQRTMLTIPDMRGDVRTSTNVVADEHNVRFYAGVPIRDDEGHMLGTISVLDDEARPEGLTRHQENGLRALSAQATLLLRIGRDGGHRNTATPSQANRATMTRQSLARVTALIQMGDDLRSAETPEAALAIAARSLGTALNADAAGFAEIDLDRGYALVEEDWSRCDDCSAKGLHDLSRHADVIGSLKTGRCLTSHGRLKSDDAVVRSMLRAPVISHGRLVGVAFVGADPGRTWTRKEIDFIRNAADRIHETVQRMRLEQDRDLRAKEIGHRLKNMLSVTRAIVSSTLRDLRDDPVVQLLDQRLDAYSGAHEILLGGEIDGASIKEALSTALHKLSVVNRISMSGPRLELNERTTYVVALLANEMATNSIKHGSLSVPEGHVDIAWRQDDDGVEMVWSESGGPTPRQPTRRGFGESIVQIGLHKKGGTELEYRPEGLHARFRAPAARVLRGPTSS